LIQAFDDAISAWSGSVAHSSLNVLRGRRVPADKSFS
jgi:hypothetical protein